MQETQGAPRGFVGDHGVRRGEEEGVEPQKPQPWSLGTERSLAGKSSQAEPFIDLLVEARTEIRKQKLWSLADMIRKRLEELEVLLEDGKEGTTWRWK